MVKTPQIAALPGMTPLGLKPTPEGVIYASGSKGPSVRGDGKGSYLERGWYVRDAGALAGPFTTKLKAERGMK